MLSMWETEKARVLQEELGVTDELDASRFAGEASVLGRSNGGDLGASTRKFPMAGSMSGKNGSSSSSSEGRDGGLVMHTKMVRYERVVGVSPFISCFLHTACCGSLTSRQELNYRRLQKQPMELCQALEETVKGDQVNPLSSRETSSRIPLL